MSVTLTQLLAMAGGIVLAGVVAHGAWQARKAGPKRATPAMEEPHFDVPAASAILDRLLHHAEIIAINGPSYRLRRNAKQSPTKTNRTTP